MLAKHMLTGTVDSVHRYVGQRVCESVTMLVGSDGSIER